MRRPWIAIPTGYDDEESKYGQDRRYLDAVEAAGGLPLLVPVMGDADLIEKYADRADGILLPGSSTDVDPAHYGSEPHERIGRVFEERDRLDFMLLDIAEQRKLPVLGICYGAQSLNVFRGGSLVQDIPSQMPTAFPHNSKGRPQEVKSHAVSVETGSRLIGVLGRTETDVNSYHHQAVRAVGSNLRVAAHSPDGVIEAIEDSRDRFVLGVQWHPETGWQTDLVSQALFVALVNSAIIGGST
jgi:putative glutamine amidotransferase